MPWAVTNLRRAEQRKMRRDDQNCQSPSMKRPSGKSNWAKLNEQKKRGQEMSRTMMKSVVIKPKYRLRGKQRVELDHTSENMDDKSVVMAWIQMNQHCMSYSTHVRAARLARFARTKVGEKAWSVLSPAHVQHSEATSSSSDHLNLPTLSFSYSVSTQTL